MLQFGLHRLATVAVNCCEGVVVVVLDVVEELLPSPPQEVRSIDKKARLMSFAMF